jgi:hypothetical protein
LYYCYITCCAGFQRAVPRMYSSHLRQHPRSVSAGSHNASPSALLKSLRSPPWKRGEKKKKSPISVREKPKQIIERGKSKTTNMQNHDKKKTQASVCLYAYTHTHTQRHTSRTRIENRNPILIYICQKSVLTPEKDNKNID